MGTILVVMVIFLGLVVTLRSLYKTKKKGGCASCPSCSHCTKKQKEDCH